MYFSTLTPLFLLYCKFICEKQNKITTKLFSNFLILKFHYFLCNFLDLTCKAYFWQKKREKEKIIEIDNRKRLLDLKPLNISEVNLNSLKLESSERYATTVFDANKKIVDNDDNVLNNKQNKDCLEQFTPITLQGILVDSKTYIKIINTQNGAPGHRIIIPVNLQQTKEQTKNTQNIIFVDIGWVPEAYDINKFLKNLENKILIIDGIVYYGDNIVRGASQNDLNKGKLISIHIKELKQLYSKSLKSKPIINNNPNEQCNFNILGFMVKRIKLNKPDNSNNVQTTSQESVNLNKLEIEYPLLKDKSELLYWYIMPETHRSYYRFWFFITSLNILSNLFVWIYL